MAQSNRDPLVAHRHGAILRSRRFARHVLLAALACGAAWVVVESANALTAF